MSNDENQKLIDEITVLSRLSNHRLREQTLKLIEIYLNEKKKQKKDKQKHTRLLKHLDKRDIVIQQARAKKDELLQQQSKMAAMGEMMDAVAHQWKQPLNSLSMMNEMLDDDFKDGLVDEAYIKDLTQTTQIQINHMVDTLSEFRNFFRPSKVSSDFSLQECIQSVQVLMKDELIKHTITLNIDILDAITLHGEINEFKHLFLNLLSNSIDAFNENNIQNRVIHIKTFLKDTNAVIEFEDNANGIPQHVIADIFKPNITTKENTKGTGIGLYMSSQIVEKHHGSISVANVNEGARFTILMKLDLTDSEESTDI